jgi:hypothetical protein
MAMAAAKPLEVRHHNAMGNVGDPGQHAMPKPAMLAKTAAQIEADKKEEERRQRHAERFDQPVPQLVYEQVVSDTGRTVTKTFRRGKLLGKGGFARCFVFTDLDTNEVGA